MLNSLDLQLSDAVIIKEDGEELIVSQIDIDQTNEKATLNLPSVLKPGNAQLMLSFKGVISDKLKGFYRSKYTR